MTSPDPIAYLTAHARCVYSMWCPQGDGTYKIVWNASITGI